MQSNLITLTHGETTVASPNADLVLQVLKGLIGAPAANAAPATDSVPAIGEYWPGQGGVYAGVMRGENGNPDYHLIVPTHDLVLNHKAIYGGYEVYEPGVARRRDGAANTSYLAVDSDEPHPAAEWCFGLIVEGFNDLYLPAIDELALCMATVPELLEKTWHLSSTQRSAYDAYSMHFDDGFQYYYVKDDELRVRPVRRFIC